MKTNELRNAIRQIVKEEVSSEVNKAMAKLMVELIKEVKSPSQERIVESKKPTPLQSKAMMLTTNPKLNAVLAETAKNFKPIPQSPGASLVSLMDGDFEKAGVSDNGNGINEPIVESKVEYLKKIVSSPAEGFVKRSITENADAVPDVLKNVFNRDFRKTMKTIDKVKQTGGSGIINASQILSG